MRRPVCSLRFAAATLAALPFALAPAALAQTPDAVGVQSPLASGARNLALGGSGVALGGDVWGGSNPAAWSTLAQREVALYADQAYTLAELRTGALRAALPFQMATVAVGAQTFGFDEYRITGGMIGAARAFRLGTTRRVHAGLAAHVQNLSIENYGSATAFSVDAGVLTDVLPRLSVGARASNLLGTGFVDAPLPRHLTVGAAFRADPRLTVVLDLDQEVREELSVRGGVEVKPVPMLTLRAGAASAPLRMGVGASVQVNRLTADLAASFHTELGVTPGLGLSARF